MDSQSDENEKKLTEIEQTNKADARLNETGDAILSTNKLTEDTQGNFESIAEANLECVLSTPDHQEEASISLKRKCRRKKECLEKKFPPYAMEEILKTQKVICATPNESTSVLLPVSTAQEKVQLANWDTQAAFHQIGHQHIDVEKCLAAEKAFANDHLKGVARAEKVVTIVEIDGQRKGASACLGVQQPVEHTEKSYKEVKEQNETAFELSEQEAKIEEDEENDQFSSNDTLKVEVFQELLRSRSPEELGGETSMLYQLIQETALGLFQEELTAQGDDHDKKIRATKISEDSDDQLLKDDTMEDVGSYQKTKLHSQVVDELEVVDSGPTTSDVYDIKTTSPHKSTRKDTLEDICPAVELPKEIWSNQKAELISQVPDELDEVGVAGSGPSTSDVKTVSLNKSLRQSVIQKEAKKCLADTLLDSTSLEFVNTKSTLESNQSEPGHAFGVRKEAKEKVRKDLPSSLAENIEWIGELKKKLRDTPTKSSASHSVFSMPSPVKLRSVKYEAAPTTEQKEIAPQFLTRQKQINVSNGERMMIRLRLYANPEPRMSIYQNQDYMQDDDNIHIFVDKENFLYSIFLIVDKVDESWDGQKLTFIATNEHGLDEASVFVKFSTPPDEPAATQEQQEDLVENQNRKKTPHFIEQVPKQVEVVPGQGTELCFSVEAHPLPTIWLEYNGQLVEPDKFETREVNENRIEVVMSMDKLQAPQDGDVFVCCAVNEFGSVKSRTKVRVRPHKHLKKKDEEEKAQPVGKLQDIDLSKAEKHEPTEDTDKELPKKKKSVPSALFIPKEITSLYGDPSVLVSTANFSTQLDSVSDQTAECTSPGMAALEQVEKNLGSAKKLEEKVPDKDEYKQEVEERKKKRQEEKDKLEQEKNDLELKKKGREEAKKAREEVEKQNEESLKMKRKLTKKRK
uniref:Ig-like domain-containing protein n=1 Tax=Ditylenchus dipsaci TaxID=166011 RepID=A0A915ERH3_9BILA